jgi:hypothetical protein
MLLAVTLLVVSCHNGTKRGSGEEKVVLKMSMTHMGNRYYIYETWSVLSSGACLYKISSQEDGTDTSSALCEIDREDHTIRLYDHRPMTLSDGTWAGLSGYLLIVDFEKQNVEVEIVDNSGYVETEESYIKPTVTSVDWTKLEELMSPKEE